MVYYTATRSDVQDSFGLTLFSMTPVKLPHEEKIGLFLLQKYVEDGVNSC